MKERERGGKRHTGGIWREILNAAHGLTWRARNINRTFSFHSRTVYLDINRVFYLRTDAQESMSVALCGMSLIPNSATDTPTRT
jgi:hypothetical protein